MRSSFPALFCLASFGCASSQPAPSAAPAQATMTTTAAVAQEQVNPAPPPPPAPDPKTAHIKVLAVSDFHGWLLPLEPKNYSRYFGGIANMAGMFTHKELANDRDTLILDNGDMWTGPTESTMLRGASVISAYNALGMDAANTANHEFDFGTEELRARSQEAKFPFLGANVMKAGTENHPDYLKGYALFDRDGVKVAVIGLTFIGTPQTTLAKHIAGLEFREYEATLKKIVPKVRSEGAEVVVVLLHDTVDVARRVAAATKDLEIAAFIAGQNHRKEKIMVDSIPVVNPGPFGRSYVRFDISVDRATRKLTGVTHEIVDVVGEVGAPAYPPSPELLAVVEDARQKAQAKSQERLGKLGRPLPLGTFQNSPVGHFVVDAWLTEFPEVDFAMVNHGALRQPLPAGDVVLGDVLGVQPFENNLMIVRITGKQLKQQLLIDHPVAGGFSWSYRERKGARQVRKVLNRRGKAIKDKKQYNVIILDFMYTGGDGYQFDKLDPAPVDTGISWRQPVINSLRQAEALDRAVTPKSGARARKVR